MDCLKGLAALAPVYETTDRLRSEVVDQLPSDGIPKFKVYDRGGQQAVREIRQPLRQAAYTRASYRRAEASDVRRFVSVGEYQQTWHAGGL